MIFLAPWHNEGWISFGPISFLAFGLLAILIFHKTSIRISIGVILICLFFVNLFGSILPQTNLDNDYWYNFNSWLIKNCEPEDLVVTGSGRGSDGYVKYYTGATVFSTRKAEQNLEKKFQEIVDLREPKRVYFTSTVYQPLEEYNNKYDNSHAKSFFSKLRKYLILVHSDSYQKIFLYNKDKE